MFFSGGYYYYIILGLQAVCLIHCFRRGTQNKWLWIIIVVPLVGSLIYIYSEILNNNSGFRTVRKPGIDVVAVVNPGGKIKKLEEKLRFADTFANKVELADAYLAAGLTDKAIELYQSGLTGAFSENEHVLAQLVTAYHSQQRYADVIPVAKKLYKLPQFPRSKAHMLYAMSLEQTGQLEAAENEFKAMKGRYSYFEQRYQYGLFLVRVERSDDARKIFTEMLNEEPHLSVIERKNNRVWFAKTRDEMRKLPVEKTV